ncbi:MAG: helix-turn-helix transcriptional regulator [Anaerotignum sp.]|nr:helix-turn-helix transcriptional regulator [Anaerotignum sp.]
MNTVELVKKLCKEKGIAISRLERDCGFSNGYIRKLKEGKFPSDRLSVIAEYLNVSIDYLLTGKEPEPNITVVDDENNVIVLDVETLELIDSLRSKPEMKMLFSVSKNATPEDIIKTVKIIEALKGKE